MTDIDPFPVAKAIEELERKPVSEPTGGIRISLSGKTGKGYEAGLINISGSEAEVAAFLNLDTTTAAYKKSPFGAIAAVWNKGHVWAQKNYEGAREAGGLGKASAPVNAGAPARATAAPRWMPEPPSCGHGRRVFRTQCLRGKLLYAWGCPEEVPEAACEDLFYEPPIGE